MKPLRFALAAVLLLGTVTVTAQRGSLVLATMVPASSVWDRILKQMASDWTKVTDGRVRLQIRSGGTVGDEATVIRRMRTNRPQVAALSLSGLGDIDPDFGVFGIPYFFESDGEARHVLERLTERLEGKLADKGLILLGWGHLGWMHIFSADPVSTLDELKATKLFVPAGDDDAQQWYKASGFQPVPLEIGDVMMGLNTGMIDAYPSPPTVALVFQWYREVSHMLDVPLAPVFSATVMTERAWRGLDAADQAAIRQSAKAAEERMWTEVPRQDLEAVAEMAQRGLTVTRVDASTARGFRALANELTGSWRGQLVPADVYDLALRERNAYRVSNGDQ